MTGRPGRPERKRPGMFVEPVRVVIRRPRHGWIAGLLGAGVKAAAVLAAMAVALVVLVGVSVLLWRAGQARIPVLVLVYGSVAMAGCGFALGRSARLLAWWPRLPDGPGQLTWQPGVGRVETGLVWEQDDPAITGSAGEGSGR
jgi:hypothetical protein